MVLDIIDILKIAITIGSVVVLILFRRQITHLLSELVSGGNSDRYKGRTSAEILSEAESRLNEVLK